MKQKFDILFLSDVSSEDSDLDTFQAEVIDENGIAIFSLIEHNNDPHNISIETHPHADGKK